MITPIFSPQHGGYGRKERTIYAVQLAQRLQFRDRRPDHRRQQKGQHTAKPSHWKTLEGIKKGRAFHLTQLQLRLGRRNIGQQLTTRLTTFGEMINQQPDKIFEMQFLPMMRGVITFMLGQKSCQWLEQYIECGTICFRVVWFAHYAALW